MVNDLKLTERHAQKDTQGIIHEMIARKLEFLLAQHPRCIIDDDYREIGNSFHLSVVSTFDTPFTQA